MAPPLFPLGVTLLLLIAWWVREFRREWRRPVTKPRRVPPRAPMRRECASAADEAERIILDELRDCASEGLVPAELLLDDRDR